MERRVRPGPLRDFCSGILEQLGVPHGDADIVADSLVEADLRGLESHGVMRMGIYVERLELGLANATPKVAVLEETPASVLLDGDHGLGAVVGVQAMDLCLRKAETAGVAMAGVRNSTHFGAAAYYAMQALPRNMIGIAVTNAPATMPPWGGRRPYLGTNPVAVAVPAGQELPVVLDMATSVVARGKIILAEKLGQSIPLGWAVDPAGKPTTDACRALEGAVLPVGGPKGYGISLIVDVLAGVLMGAPFGPHIGNLYGNRTEPQRLGHAFGVINVAAFAGVERFKAEMDQLIHEVKIQPRAEGVERIYLPGEIEFEAARERGQRGIPLPEEVWQMLVDLGRKWGVPWESVGLAEEAERG